MTAIERIKRDLEMTKDNIKFYYELIADSDDAEYEKNRLSWMLEIERLEESEQRFERALKVLSNKN